MKGLVKLIGAGLVIAGVYLVGIEVVGIFEFGMMFVFGCALAIV